MLAQKLVLKIPRKNSFNGKLAFGYNLSAMPIRFQMKLDKATGNDIEGQNRGLI